MVWTEIILVPLFGQNPLKWHLFALLIRWLNAVAFYILLKRIWPDQRWLLRWSALLLVVYPGFNQQALAATYSRYILVGTLAFISFELMLRAIQDPGNKIIKAAISTFLGILQVISIEYFVGLELLRPLLIYLCVEPKEPDWKRRLKRTFLFWAPYILILFVFVVVRLILMRYIFTSGNPHPLVFLGQLAASPFRGLINWVIQVVQNAVYVTLTVWTDPLQPAIMAVDGLKTLLPWVAGVIAAALAIWVTYYWSRGESDSLSTNPIVGLMCVGATIILVGLIPLLLLGRSPMIGKWSDRFTLPLMYGSVLLVVAAVAWFGKTHVHQGLVWGFLLALSITTQIQTTSAYALEWANFKKYLWQLVWRAPQLQIGTVIVSADNPFNTMADYSFGFAVNQVYSTSADPGKPEFWWLEAEDFDLTSWNSLSAHDFKLRNIQFTGRINQSIMVDFAQNGSCLRILDNFYEGAAPVSKDLETTGLMLPLASTQAIQADTPQRLLPTQIFGSEPAHDWCYYYEKADLARQENDWSQVISLYHQAYALNITPKNSAERLPLIEAYLRAGQWDNAFTETPVDKKNWFNDDAFCRIWQIFPLRAGDPSLQDNKDYQQRLVEVNRILDCTEEYTH